MNEETKDVNVILDLDEWQRAVKQHAERVLGMMSHNVFGRRIGDNKDALIVAVYLKGVEEGGKNYRLLLEEYQRQIKAELKSIYKIDIDDSEKGN